jgi:hypothetical protein
VPWTEPTGKVSSAISLAAAGGDFAAVSASATRPGPAFRPGSRRRDARICIPRRLLAFGIDLAITSSRRFVAVVLENLGEHARSRSQTSSTTLSVSISIRIRPSDRPPGFFFHCRSVFRHRFRQLRT